jgi:hypothetical protein
MNYVLRKPGKQIVKVMGSTKRCDDCGIVCDFLQDVCPICGEMIFPSCSTVSEEHPENAEWSRGVVRIRTSCGMVNLVDFLSSRAHS